MATDSALYYTINQVDRLAAFEEHIDVELHVHGWNPALNSYKVTVHNKHKIVNMYADRDYVERKIPISTIPDQFTDLQVKGQVLLIRVTRNDTTKDYVKYPQDISDRFDMLVDFQIPKNDYILLDHDYWLWFSSGQNFWLNGTRWIEAIDLSIHNHSHEPFCFSSQLNFVGVEGSGVYRLEKGSSVRLRQLQGMPPGDILIFETSHP